MRLLPFRRGLTAAAAVVAAAVALASEPTAQEPIRIGTFLALTGPAALAGEAQKRTLDLYIARLNQAGGVLGRQLELATYDTGGNGKDAVAGAARLLGEGRSDFLIGGTTPGEAQAVGQLVERSERPFISLAGLPSLERQQHWAFTAAPSLRMAVEKVLVDLRKERIDELGLIAGSSTSDVACLTEARSAAARREVVIKAVEQYQQADFDVTRQLSHLRAAGADAILFCGFGAPGMHSDPQPGTAPARPATFTTPTPPARASSSPAPARLPKASGFPVRLCSWPASFRLTTRSAAWRWPMHKRTRRPMASSQALSAATRTTRCTFWSMRSAALESPSRNRCAMPWKPHRGSSVPQEKSP